MKSPVLHSKEDYLYWLGKRSLLGYITTNEIEQAAPTHYPAIIVAHIKETTQHDTVLKIEVIYLDDFNSYAKSTVMDIKI